MGVDVAVSSGPPANSWARVPAFGLPFQIHELFIIAAVMSEILGF
jgi:hypothetical protein